MVDYRYDRKSNQSGPPEVIYIPIVYIVVLFVDVIFCLHYICILLLLKGKDPDLIYLCRLVTPIEKKEPITPDMLLKLYNSVFKDLPLQNFGVFPSYYELRGAILFSNLIMCRFLFLKVKLTYIATEIELSYPEWIATCIQLKGLEKYLFLLNRNLTKCKGRFVLNCERRIDHFR